MSKQPYATRKLLRREDIDHSFMRFSTDRLKSYARRDLLESLERAIEINDFVIMFSEEVINDREHPEYGGIIVNALAYPKSLFNGGSFS